MTQVPEQSICPEVHPLDEEELPEDPLLEEDEEPPEDPLLEDDPPDDEEVEVQPAGRQIQRVGSKALQGGAQLLPVKLQVQVLL